MGVEGLVGRPAAATAGLSFSGWWVRLSGDVAIAMLGTSLPARTAIEVRQDAAPFRPASQLQLPDGGLLLLFRAAGANALEIRVGDGPWHPLGPAAPPSRLTERAAELPSLLALLAGKAAGPLRAGGDAALARDLLAVAEPLAVEAPDGVGPIVGLMGGRALWRLDGGGWLVTPHGISRVPEPEAGLAPAAAPLGGLLLRGDAPPIRLPRRAAPPTLVEIARGVAATPPGTLRQAFAALRRHVNEPWCRDAIRDAQVLAMSPPRAAAEPSNAIAGALDRAISDGGGGVYCFGWLHDPLRLLRGMTLRGPFGPVAVPSDAIFRMSRPDISKRFENAPFGQSDTRPGFVFHIPDAGPGPVAQWKLELALGSGDAIELVSGPALIPPAQAREAVLRSVNALEVGPELLDRCIGPAAERLHRAASAEPVGQEVIRIGEPPKDPVASVVIPLYRNLRFVRHQVGAFARDPMLRASEIIYVLDSPEQRGEVEHLLRGHCGLTRLPVTLVVHGRNAGYATACNSGAAITTAPVLLQLNSDVVPDAPGWLKPMLAQLEADRGVSCVGPKLMFDDGSLQHAGLYFARGPGNDWFNCHYYKGFPRHYPDADRAREVPGVTGAAMLMRRSAWDEVGGFHADYIVGDYEDSDLCLRLRQAGGRILYEPQAELYHFERQSIAQHGGYAGTVAAAYNRRLHHRRWSDTIEALMARFTPEGQTFAAA